MLKGKMKRKEGKELKRKRVELSSETP